MSNKDTEIKSSYDDCSVEELQKTFKDIFFASGEFSDADIEEMDQIVAVLKKKRPITHKYTLEESWELFQETYSEEFARLGIRNTEEVMEKEPETVVETGPVRVAAVTSDTETVDAKPGASIEEKRPRKYGRTLKQTALIAAAVVAVMVIITVTAGAIGIDIWSWVPVWNDSTFRFVPEDSASMTSLNIPEALKQLGVEDPLFPTWIPEGFILDEQQIRMDDPASLYVTYLYRDRVIMITIMSLPDVPGPVATEKNDPEPLRYVKGGNEHFIFQNVEKTVATWNKGTLIVRISGDISLEETEKIIDSIYEVVK